jgi:hypothetical protein
MGFWPPSWHVFSQPVIMQIIGNTERLYVEIFACVTLGILHETYCGVLDWCCQRLHFILGFSSSFSRTAPPTFIH